MAGKYVKNGKGALFKNGYKTSDSAPDYRGSVTLDIKLGPGEYEIVGWKRESKEGNSYLSLQLGGLKDAGPGRAPAKREPTRDEDEEFTF